MAEQNTSYASFYYGNNREMTQGQPEQGNIFYNTENTNIYIATPLSSDTKLTPVNVGTTFDMYRRVMKDLVSAGITDKVIVMTDDTDSIEDEYRSDSQHWLLVVSPNVTTIGDGDYPCFYSSDGPLVNVCSIKHVVLPPSGLSKLTCINNKAFSMSKISELLIPDSVTSIGSDAFSGCTSLKRITIPDSVTSIVERVFSGCSSLTSITIPNSVTSIGIRAFSGCTGLTSITIPKSVESIGKSAFYNCSSLTNLIFQNGCLLQDIHDYAFYECKKIDDLRIPSNVSLIGDYAFFNVKIGSHTIEDIQEAPIRELGYMCFSSTTNTEGIRLNNDFYFNDHIEHLWKCSFKEVDDAVRRSEETIITETDCNKYLGITNADGTPNDCGVLAEANKNAGQLIILDSTKVIAYDAFLNTGAIDFHSLVIRNPDSNRFVKSGQGDYLLLTTRDDEIIQCRNFSSIPAPNNGDSQTIYPCCFSGSAATDLTFNCTGHIICKPYSFSAPSGSPHNINNVIFPDCQKLVFETDAFGPPSSKHLAFGQQDGATISLVKCTPAHCENFEFRSDCFGNFGGNLGELIISGKWKGITIIVSQAAEDIIINKLTQAYSTLDDTQRAKIFTVDVK